MSTALGLAMQISANTAQLATAISDVNKKLDSLGNAGKKAADDLGALKTIEIAKLAIGGVKAATSTFLSFSASVTGAVKSVASFALSVGEELDGLNDIANRTGVGVEALQGYARAAAATGIEVDAFAAQIQKLTIAIGNATLSDKDREKFEALGIVFEELKASTPEKQFEMVVDAISRIADPAERAAQAVKFFGKGGIQMGELFTMGPGALAKMREEAVALGQVVSKDAISAIDNMNDSFGAVFATVKGITGQVLGELAGPITEITNNLLEVIRSTGPQQIAGTIAQGLLDFISAAGNAFFELAKFIQAFVKKFGPLLGLDMSTEAEKELAGLRQQQAAGASVVGMGGMGGVTPPSMRAAALTPEQIARMAELQKQIEAEKTGSGVTRFQANFNSAIDNASRALQARGGQVEVVGQDEQLKEQKRTNELLERQAGGTVDILGA